MSDVKRNHVAPTVYLNSFSVPGRLGFVYASTRTERGWSRFKTPLSTEAICWYEDVYTIIKDKVIDRRTLETLFNNSFEKDWPRVLISLKEIPFFIYSKPSFCMPKTVINYEIRETIIRFIHFQYKRSLSRLETLKANWPKFTKKQKGKLKKAMGRLSGPQAKALLARNSFTSFLLQSFLSDSGIVEEVLRRKKWRFWINHTSTPFITSDNPVLWFDQVRKGETEIMYFPLTPTVAIEIQKNFTLAELIEVQTLSETDMAEITAFNKLIRNFAYRQIVSNNIATLSDTIKDP